MANKDVLNILASLEIYGDKSDDGVLEVSGISIQTDPSLKIFSTLMNFLGSVASGAGGVVGMLPALLPVLLPELRKVFEGLRSGSLAEDEPLDMATLVEILSNFGLKVVKPDGAELTSDEVEAYGTTPFEDDEEDEEEEGKPPAVNKAMDDCAAGKDLSKPSLTDDELATLGGISPTATV